MASASDHDDSFAAREGWREADSSLFIDYGHAFTPERERQHDIICDLIASVTPKRVVELCCGAGDQARLLLERLPHATLLALDGSSAMLEQTRTACAGQSDRLTLQHFDLAALEVAALDPPQDAIYSSLAVHHLDGPGKQQLFEKLHAALRPGGILVLCDLIEPTSDVGWRVAADDWDRAVAERSAQIYGDDRAERKFAELHWNYYRWPDDESIDQPSTVAEHIAWLAACGFEAIELHWLLAGHAIFSARRSAT
ncbi:MAG: methyltransferase domain-containing protein [Pseudomonadota bacterium]